jgi:PPOX class probable F420-dependent enzyme
VLEQPLVAVLATYRRDGTVLLSPVWHEWRDNGFNVVTGSRNVKAGHLRRDPRASIVVCEDGPPYRGLELRARARLSMPEDRSILRRIATRYLARKRVSGTPRLQVTTCSSAWSRASCAIGIFADDFA